MQDIAYTMPTANAQSWTDISATQLYEIIMVCLNTTYFTENWKHYSKIIFKCVNSTVRPIFNEVLLKKNRFVSLMNSAWDPLKKHKTLFYKKKETQTLAVSSISKYPNRYLDCNWHTSPTLISMSNLDIVDYIVDYALLLYDIDILFSLPEI